MNHNLKWLNKIEKEIEDQSDDDLYYLIETMYKEQKMNFLQFLYDASRGVGCIVHEGLEYVLDQDLDDPKEFDEVTFLVGDYESSTIPPQKFVDLMQIISDSYIKAHPSETDSIAFYMNKLRERYSK